jgi:hypothetical protein
MWNPHRARCALSRNKAAAVAPIKIGVNRSPRSVVRDRADIAEAVVAGGLGERSNFRTRLLVLRATVAPARLGDLAHFDFLASLRTVRDIREIANSGKSVEGQTEKSGISLESLTVRVHKDYRWRGFHAAKDVAARMCGITIPAPTAGMDSVQAKESAEEEGWQLRPA